jgi:hypothetical protein
MCKNLHYGYGWGFLLHGFFTAVVVHQVIRNEKAPIKPKANKRREDPPTTKKRKKEKDTFLSLFFLVG